MIVINISYFRELLEGVDVEKMCSEIGMQSKYLNMCLNFKELIDSTRLNDIMNYLDLTIEQKIKLCTFRNNKDLCAFGVNI